MGNQQNQQPDRSKEDSKADTVVNTSRTRPFVSEPNYQPKTAPNTARSELTTQKTHQPPPLRYLPCSNASHQQEPLTSLCIDEACRNRSVLCVHCCEAQHWNHHTVTLQEFHRHLAEMRSETTTANYVRNCLESIASQRSQFNSQLQLLQDKVVGTLRELQRHSDSYFKRVQTMLEGELKAYQKLTSEDFSAELEGESEQLMAAYRKLTDRLVESRHHRGQLITQLDCFEKKISEQQKQRRKGIEERSNTLMEQCQQIQIAMEASVEKFRFRQSKLDPIQPSMKSNWRQIIFEGPQPTQTTQKPTFSTDANQRTTHADFLDVSKPEESFVAEVPLVVPKKRHVHPQKTHRPVVKKPFDDPEELYAVVNRWSPTLRHTNAYINDGGDLVVRLIDSKEIVEALADTPLNQARLPIYIWTLRVVRMARQVAMGIRLAQKAKKLGHVFHLNLQQDQRESNGHYVATSDGWMYWRERQRYDMSQHKGFTIKEGDQIRFTYNLEQKKLEIRKDNHQICTFDVRAAPVSDFYHPCVYLWDADDCVEIVQEGTRRLKEFNH